MADGLIAREIDATMDDHVWITIRCPDRPTVSLDVANEHGRRTLSVRIDGMGIGGHLLDIDPDIGPAGDAMRRFCPYCGESVVTVSSKTHRCEVQKTESLGS